MDKRHELTVHWKRFMGMERREGLQPLWAFWEEGVWNRWGWKVERRGGLESPDEKNRMYWQLGEGGGWWVGTNRLEMFRARFWEFLMLNVMLRDLSFRPWEWLRVLGHANYLIQRRSVRPLWGRGPGHKTLHGLWERWREYELRHVCWGRKWWGLTFSLVQTTSVSHWAWRKVKEPVTATVDSSKTEKLSFTGLSHPEDVLSPHMYSHI